MTEAQAAQKPRACPRDHAGLVIKSLAGVTIDECPTCAGVWLDAGELKELQEGLSAMGPLETEETERAEADTVARAEAIAQAAVAEAQAEAASHASECPVCDASLVREEYANTSQVLIDVCPLGCGIWLDRGELSTLETFYETERARVTEDKTENFLFKVREVWAGFVGALHRRPRKKKPESRDVEV